MTQPIYKVTLTVLVEVEAKTPDGLDQSLAEVKEVISGALKQWAHQTKTEFRPAE